MSSHPAEINKVSEPIFMKYIHIQSNQTHTGNWENHYYSHKTSNTRSYWRCSQDPSEIWMVWLNFQTIKKWQHPQNSVHHLYVSNYHKIQIYSDPEYILGLKKPTFTINIIYTQEYVQMGHPFLRVLTSLYHMHQWMASANFTLSYQLHLQKASLFFLGHLQLLSEYHFTQPWIKSLSKFTIYIYLEWYKCKCTKHPLSSRDQRELRIQEIKPIQGTKPAGKFWYDLMK